MPRLSVWLVRTALGYLAIGMSLGAIILAAAGLGAVPWRARLVPVHAELLLVGWTVQLVMGVAYWILPRHVTGPERGNPVAAWAGYVTLNAGVILASVGGALGSRASSVALAGRGLEALSAATFVAQAWPRIRRSRVQA